jgi:hypothetical protein
MDSPEITWRALCFKLATEQDPIRVALFVEMLNDLSEAYVKQLRAKPSLLNEIDVSRCIH